MLKNVWCEGEGGGHYPKDISMYKATLRISFVLAAESQAAGNQTSRPPAGADKWPPTPQLPVAPTGRQILEYIPRTAEVRSCARQGFPVGLIIITGGEVGHFLWRLRYSPYCRSPNLCGGRILAWPDYNNGWSNRAFLRGV